MVRFSLCVVATLAVLAVRRANGASLRSDADCGSFTLCHTCGSKSGCVWCADNGGKCLSGSSSGGQHSQCSADGLVSTDYCVNERCGQYSACESCATDPLCGWCANGGLHGKGICVEGEATAPLTGSCPAWAYGKCDVEALGAAEPSSADATAGGDDPAGALSDIEKVAAEMSQQKKLTESDEKQLLDKDKKAFNVIRGIKDIITGYQTRKEHEITATSHYKGEFEKKLEEVMAKRRTSLEKVRALLKQEYQEEVQEAGLVHLYLSEQEKTAQEQSRLVNGFDPSKLNAGAEVDTVTDNLFREEKAMQGLERFLSGLTHRDHQLMADLKAQAHTSVEHELHLSALRKMAREEAAWYSCSWLSESKSHDCADFSAKYSGQQKDGDLTAEEHTRVCNEVETKLDDLPATIKRPTTGLSRDVYLSWCVNHVNILCAKCEIPSQDSAIIQQDDAAAAADAAAADAVAR